MYPTPHTHTSQRCGTRVPVRDKWKIQGMAQIHEHLEIYWGNLWENKSWIDQSKTKGSTKDETNLWRYLFLTDKSFGVRWIDNQ